MSSVRPVPRARLRPPSIRNPASLRSSPAPQVVKTRTSRQCPNCSTPDIQERDGQLVCVNCGAIISDSVIVNDVTFGETPSGAAHVQGTTVHEGQRYAKPSGAAFRRGGRTAEDTQESSMRAAKEHMVRLANALYISNLVDRAYRLYQLGRNHNFHRPVEETVAICLYITCRQTKGNTTLLIDFAERIKQNVFDLGSVYKKFINDIGLARELSHIPLVEIEPLLYKFAKRLEFADLTRHVANDAAQILSRMDRDWMVTGRQPAALCGAALILAARMNNFRRSVREVVYIVKAGDATIARRLEEFRRTKAGRLTVTQFRTYSSRLKDTAIPPSLYRAQEKLEAERRRKETATPESSVDPELENSSPVRQVDADGFAIPAKPVKRTRAAAARASEAMASCSRTEPDSSETQEPPTVKRKRGRPRKEPIVEQTPETSEGSQYGDDADEQPRRKRRRRKKDPPIEPIEVTEDDLRAEGELELEISSIIQRRIDTEEIYQVTAARAKAIAEAERERERQRTVSDDIIIREDEFDNDPEVVNCLLSAAEIEVKEMIWVTHNHEWMRRQQQILLERAMEEAIGKKKRRNKRTSKVGSEHDSPASTPAEATQRLLERKNTRPTFSRHINYEKLQQIYGPFTVAKDKDEVASQTSDSKSVGETQTRGGVDDAVAGAERDDNEEVVEEIVEDDEEEVVRNVENEDMDDDEDDMNSQYSGDYDDGEDIDYDRLAIEQEEYFE